MSGKNTQITFSETVKSEICSLTFSEDCFFALFRAYIDAQEGDLRNLQLTTQFVKIFKFLVGNLHQFDPGVENAIYYTNQTVSKKRKYVIEFGNLEHLKTKMIVPRRRDCERAYITGIFLACGSLSDPAGKYHHLELRLKNNVIAQKVIRLLHHFAIEAHSLSYRDYELIYLKKVDQISDFLKLINAAEQFYNFENLKISRDFSQTIQRLANLEVANIKKIVAANNQTLLLFQQVSKTPYRQMLNPRDLLFWQLLSEDTSQSLRLIADRMSSQGLKTTKSTLYHIRQKLATWLNK